MVSETWIDVSSHNLHNIPNYRFEHSTQTEFRGKGAGIFILNTLPYSRRNDLESNLCEYQSVFIELRTMNCAPAILGCLYRSPSYPPALFLDYLERTLENINIERKICLIGGDVNIDLLKHLTSDVTAMFFNLLASLSFLPCISLPTRISSTSKTLIDNFFCNNISLLSQCNVILSDLSDHLPIITNFQLEINGHNSKKHNYHNAFDFRKVESLKAKLENCLINFHEIQDAKRACHVITEVLSIEISNHSIKKPSRKNTPIQPWISHELLRRINKKNELHKNFILSPTVENHSIFKRYRNSLTSMVREAKRNYFARKLEENSDNPKKMWKILLEDIVKRPTNKNPLPEQFYWSGIHRELYSAEQK